MISIDLETTLISDKEPIPRMVCFGHYNGSVAYVSTEMIDLVKILTEARLLKQKVIFHNSAFDLSVLWQAFEQVPEKQTYQQLLIDLIEDNLITDTYIRQMLYDLSVKGHITKGYSLGALSEQLLGRPRLDKEDGWRLRYGELMETPLADWPTDAVDYVKQDVIDTYEIWKDQEEFRRNTGPGSMNTETLQIAANLALALSTGRGVRVDTERLKVMGKNLLLRAQTLQNRLVVHGLGEYNNKGKFKRNFKAFREFIATITTPSYTEKGNIKINKDELKKLDDANVSAWDEYSSLQKLATSYIPKLLSETGLVHPSYDILKETGRTSSKASKNYPSLNIQNIPRFPGIRESFIPREGKVFVSIDYSNLELCSAAQVLGDIYRTSPLQDTINQGDTPVDLHTKLGEKLAEMDGHEKDLKYYRTLAKPINLGYPGGIGPKKVAQIAKATYDIEVSEDQARAMRKLFLKEYPRLKEFLTKYAYRHLKPDGAFFYETNGRHRNNCTYTSFCNGKAMQSLAADGAKLAAWELLKKRLDFVAFIHDEFIFEFDSGDETRIQQAMEVMVDAMQTVMPDVRITVEASVMADHWTKDGPFLKTEKYWKDPVKEDAHVRTTSD